MRIKALQLTWHSAFQSRSGSILASTLGASATVGGLCHAAERRSVRDGVTKKRGSHGEETQASASLAP
jgi:hypothetical protein